MHQIDRLMKKGESNLTNADIKELQKFIDAVKKFEDEHYSLPKPQTLLGMLELKMFEMKMNQKEMAVFLGIAASKFSQILNKKRNPDIEFLKIIYIKLKIDPKFILDHI
ncbi:helix-turn-helix transcriptional regulator [Chitinophaga sp. XS-30]|uniref:helix-turn-helix domain-containing protein n=1 Tax=Chitinophaga sp. XS-30 TaxID=2604421 RepID=UPI001AEF7B15|nr:helix-turn-helix transcriptional regulator [Chitinophaga sp. XS-30]